MTTRCIGHLLACVLVSFVSGTGEANVDEGLKMMNVGGKALVCYQAAPMEDPVGGPAFRGSDFFHPLKTPSGFIVTDLQPEDHLHHFGLWWPWKYLEVGERKILCWELQEGDGIIRTEGAEAVEKGILARSNYWDRKCETGERVILNETMHAQLSEIVDPCPTATGYFLDLKLVNQTPLQEPVTVTSYRYSGFSFRGTRYWTKDNCEVITSAGNDYSDSNFTRARWVKIEGENDSGTRSGVLLMSDSENRDFPETLRTWNPDSENGAVFVNFNSVKERPWVFQHGSSYTRQYRVFVYDGILSEGNAESMWEQFQDR